MSRTYDAEVESLASRAAEAGMAGPELRAWRRVLSPRSLDSCGCEAGAKTAVASGSVALVVLPILWGIGPALLWSLAVVFVAAVVGKLAGQRAAAGRRRRLIGILEERIRELVALKP